MKSSLPVVEDQSKEQDATPITPSKVTDHPELPEVPPIEPVPEMVRRERLVEEQQWSGFVLVGFGMKDQKPVLLSWIEVMEVIMLLDAECYQSDSLLPEESRAASDH